MNVKSAKKTFIQFRDVSTVCLRPFIITLECLRSKLSYKCHIDQCKYWKIQNITKIMIIITIYRTQCNSFFFFFFLSKKPYKGIDCMTFTHQVRAFLFKTHLWCVCHAAMGCNECTHPSCQHSLNSMGIGQCVECDGGVLVLDPNSGPKWKMACNKCNVVVHFFEHAHRVQVRSIGLLVFEIKQSHIWFVRFCLTFTCRDRITSNSQRLLRRAVTPVTLLW